MLFTVVQQVLDAAGVHPRQARAPGACILSRSPWPEQAAAMQIGILVVNCSIFGPTPSLSAMIINHFKLRSDIARPLCKPCTLWCLVLHAHVEPLTCCRLPSIWAAWVAQLACWPCHWRRTCCRSCSGMQPPAVYSSRALRLMMAASLCRCTAIGLPLLSAPRTSRCACHGICMQQCLHCRCAQVCTACCCAHLKLRLLAANLHSCC